LCECLLLGGEVRSCVREGTGILECVLVGGLLSPTLLYLQSAHTTPNAHSPPKHNSSNTETFREGKKIKEEYKQRSGMEENDKREVQDSCSQERVLKTHSLMKEKGQPGEGKEALWKTSSPRLMLSPSNNHLPFQTCLFSF
jgi:hypothetical protein